MGLLEDAPDHGQRGLLPSVPFSLGQLCAQAVADFAGERLELGVFAGERVPANVDLVIGPILVRVELGEVARGETHSVLDVAARRLLRRQDPPRRRRARADAIFARAVGRPPYQNLCGPTYASVDYHEELDGPQRSVPFVLFDVVVFRDRCEAGTVLREVLRSPGMRRWRF